MPRRRSEVCCSRPCSLKRSRRIQCAKKRALVRAALVEHVDPAVVFARDRMRCQLCGLKVEEGATQFADTKATIDHIVPLSKGGAHSYANVQTACWPCNYRKRDTTFGQMRFA